MTDILSEAVKAAREDPNRPAECLLSQFLNSQEGEVTCKSGFIIRTLYITNIFAWCVFNFYTADNVNRLAFELMAAGVDTTTLTLVWCCYAVSSDKLKFTPGETFTETHLEVVHRLASVVPMALPHRARFDSRIAGYLVPKDSVIFFNLFAVHNNQLKEIIAVAKSIPNGCPFRTTSPTAAISTQKMYFCETAMPFSVGEI